MNDDEGELNIIVHKSCKLLPNIQTGAVGPGRVAPPITTIPAPPLLSNPNNPINLSVPRTQRRAIQTTQLIPNLNTYGGAYNNYPFRGMTSMNLGGFNNPYGAYGQPTMNSQYQNPVVIAAAESSRPAFESIQSVVQSFNSVSMMLESTFTAMHMSFQALLGVAENFTRLRMFMMKLYSTIVSFKLARWFLTKVFYLLRMVRGGRGSSAEEDLWTALSSTEYKEINPSDGRSWPLVVFTGLLAATPYFVYKLLNSVTPVSDPIASNPLPSSPVPTNTNMVLAKAQSDWTNIGSNPMSLVKGQSYLTSQESLTAAKETGWLLVENPHGIKGYVPLNAFKMRKTDNQPTRSQMQVVSNVISDPAPSNSIPEQVQPQLSTPVTDEQGNPIALPHPLVDCDKSSKNDS